MLKNLLIGLLCHVGCLAVESAKKISTLNLLLPLSNDVKVEYVLEAFHGCYAFSSSEPAIISVAEVEDQGAGGECGTRARVRVETAAETRAITWLTAQEESSGSALRCEARVASLERLEIVTRLRTVDVGNLETVEVIGFDRQGNVFSSLEGLRFHWQIVQGKGLGEFASFRAAGFRASDRRQKIEDLNGQSDQVVLLALRTGRVRLSVRAAEERYKTIEASVELFFVEHIIARPESPLVLLPCSSTRLSFFRLAGGKGSRRAEPLPNPGARFRHTASNKDLVQVSESYDLVSGEALGTSLLELFDLDQQEPLMQFRVSVAEPESFELAIRQVEAEGWAQWPERLNWSPKTAFFESSHDLQFADHWSAVVGGVYIIRPLLRAKSGEELTLNQERLTWTLDRAGLELLHDGNHFVIVRALRAGPAAVEAEVLPQRCRTRALKRAKDLPVYSPVRVVAPRNERNEVFLPSPGSVSDAVYFSLEAVGGSGAYHWQVEDPGVASLPQGGQLLAQRPGRTVVRCSDAVNKGNKDHFVLVVENLAQLRAVERRKEGEERQSLFVLFRAVGPSGQFFANCTLAGIRVALARQEDVSAPGFGPGERPSPDYSAALVGWDAKGRLGFVRNLTEAAGPGFVKEAFGGIWLDEHSHSYRAARTAERQEWLSRLLAQQRAAGLCGAVRVDAASAGSFELELQAPSLPAEKVQIRVYQPFAVQFPERYDPAVMGGSPLLAYGSGIRLLLTGGPRAWADGGDPLVIASASDAGAFAEVAAGHGSQGVELVLSCKPESGIARDSFKFLNPADLRKAVSVVVTSSNAETKELVSPFTARVGLTIECARPSAIRLFQLTAKNARKYRFLESHKNLLLLRNEKTYEFAFWTFDERARAFWNFTSVPVKLRAESPAPAAFDSFKRLASAAEGGSDERLGARQVAELASHGSEAHELALNARSGQVLLHARIYCKGSFLCVKQSLVNDTLTITTTKRLAVEPKTSQLLLIPDNEAELAIINGSGSFRVWTPEPHLLAVGYKDGGKTIGLTPLAKGKARVFVEDLGLETPLKTFAEVEVVGYESLAVVLDRPRIVRGQSATATIGGSGALKSQLANCSIRLLAHPAEGLVVSKLDDLTFALRAEAEGEFSLNAEINRTLLGGAARLVVFPPLGAFPAKIVVMPGCEAHFKLTGASPDIFSAEYKISVRGAEALGALGQVQQGVYKLVAGPGPAIAKVAVTAEPLAAGEPAFSAQLLVEVALPDSLVVRGPYKLLEGARAFLQATPARGAEEFTPALCDVSLLVESSSAENVLSVAQLPAAGPRGPSQLTAYVAARRPGREFLQFRMLFTGGQAAKRLPLAANYTVTVFENVEVQSAGFLDQEGTGCGRVFGHSLLLLPPRASLELPPRLLPTLAPHDRAVALQDGNKLLSGEALGVDTVLLEDSESKAKSALVTRVQLPAHLVLEGVQKVTYMHPRTTASVRVRYMDAFGRLFAPPAGGIPCEAFVSDPNLVDFKLDRGLSQITLTARSAGRALLTVQSSLYPRLSLTVPLTIGSLLQPQGTVVVHVGGEVQFKTPQDELRSAYLPKEAWRRPGEEEAAAGRMNRWGSSASAILDIDPVSGAGVAKRPGNATVSFDSPIAVKTEVTAVEARALNPAPGNPAFITNIPTNENFRQKYLFRFSPTFEPPADQLTLSPLVNHNLDYNCTVNSKLLAARKGAADLGEFACELAFLSAKAELPQSVTLTISLWSRAYAFRLEEAVAVQVITAFQYSLPDDRIDLTAEDRGRTFSVRTVSKLSVVPDPQLRPYVTSAFFPGNMTQRVTVQIEEGLKEPLRGAVEIANPLSGQKRTVAVSFEPRQSLWARLLASVAAGNELSFSDLVVIFICILILLFIVRELKHKRASDDDREYNTISRMSNSRSLNYSTPRNPF